MTTIRIYYVDDAEGIIGRDTVEFPEGTTGREMMHALDWHVVANHPLGSHQGRYKLGYQIHKEAS